MGCFRNALLRTVSQTQQDQIWTLLPLWSRFGLEATLKLFAPHGSRTNTQPTAALLLRVPRLAWPREPHDREADGIPNPAQRAPTDRDPAFPTDLLLERPADTGLVE